MAKNMTSNKEVVKSEVNFLLSRLRGAIAYEGKDKCSVYLAGVHKETYETLTSMGIKWDVKRWCTFLFAPKKGTKAYTALFNGSKVLDEAKAYKEAKVAAFSASCNFSSRLTIGLRTTGFSTSASSAASVDMIITWEALLLEETSIV
jgi:hypothetical protein